MVSLEAGDEPAGLLSQSMRFPAGRPLAREPAARLGISAFAHPHADGAVLTVRSTRLAYGVRVHAPGFEPADDAFSLEPGRERLVALHRTQEQARLAGGSLSALNLDAPVRIEVGPA